MKLRRKLALLSAAVLGVAGVAVMGSTSAQATGQGHTPVGICHATSSDSNPYVWLTADDDSVKYEGHLAHRNDPNKTWQNDGTWNGKDHKAGDLKPDLIEGLDQITQKDCEKPVEPTCSPTPTPTPTETSESPTPTPTETSESPTPTPTETSETPTPTPTETSETPTPTPTPTETSETPTPTPTETSETPTPTPTETSETPTPTPTETTPTATPTPTETTPTSTPTTTFPENGGSPPPTTLPRTGSSSTVPLGIGALMLLVAGALLIAATYRRPDGKRIS